MKIKLNSIIVQNQDHALRFYTEVLGFHKMLDIPMGPEFRWLTVISAEDPDGAQLVLEPAGHPAAVAYQKALFEAGIPLTAFAVDHLENEYIRLLDLGVVFKTKPTNVGTAIVAAFEDTCGNFIQLYQVL